MGKMGVTDRETDEVLEKAAQAPHVLPAALLQRIAGSLPTPLTAVRPLPPAWVLTCTLVLLCAAVAVAGAARAGFYGFEKMSGTARVLISSALLVLAWISGAGFVHAMIPGSRRRATPAAILGLGTLTLAGVLALLFRDYRISHFISAGIVCLLVGLCHAIPAGLLSWLVLRRGFAVNPVAAGLVAGTLAGLAGVGMLELHCANFQAAHVLVWHTAVVPLSGSMGALLAWMLRARSPSSG